MYKFKKFDINKIINEENPSILIIGESSAGKTTLIKDFIHRNTHKYITNDNIVFASFRGRGHDFFKYRDDHIIKENYINTEYNENILEEHINKKINEINKNNKENTYIILDGVIHTNKVFNTDKSLQEIQFNGKHYFITSIITQQYPIQMTPEYRANFDYIILFNVTIKSSIKKIYDYYGGMFPTFDTFYNFFKEFTFDHGCMIIDNTIHHGDASDIISWYKVDIHKYDKTENKSTHQIILYSKL